MKRVFLSCSLIFVTCCQMALAEDWQTVLEQAQSDLRKNELSAADVGFNKAFKMLEAAKAADKDELKKFGFALIDCLVGISKVKDRQGDPAESEKVYEMGLETLKKFCENGWRNQQYADYLPGIIELYDRHGKTREAEGALKRFEDIRTNVTPKDNNQIIACYELCSKFLRSHQRSEEATVYETKVSQMKYSQQ